MHSSCMKRCSFNNSLVFFGINALILRKHISNNKMSQGQVCIQTTHVGFKHQSKSKHTKK